MCKTDCKTDQQYRNRGKTRGGSYLVMAGLVPAISIIGALCHPDRDRRDKPGDDAMSFAPVTKSRPNSLSDLRDRQVT